MDTRDGRILTEEQMKKLPKADFKFMRPMIIPPTLRQKQRKPPKIGRNELCPCGSGKKFKKCCLKGRWG